MAEKGEEKEYVFYIPPNFTQKHKYFGFRLRNILETVLVIITLLSVVSLTPFVVKVKLIIDVTLSVALGFFFLNGVRNRSITEWLMDYIRFKKNGKKMRMRTVREDKFRKIAAVDEKGEQLSLVERVMKQATQGKKVKVENIDDVKALIQAGVQAAIKKIRPEEKTE